MMRLPVPLVALLLLLFAGPAVAADWGDVGTPSPGPTQSIGTYWAGCIQGAPLALGGFGLGAAEARITATLYLADLATRYLADRQAQAGALLGAPGAWLIPAITDHVRRL